jgi:hypothetical protein
MLPGGPLASLIRRRYCGAVTGGTGPISTTLTPPADEPPAGPSVNSQAWPRDSAASAVGPAAAWAWASVGKVSSRQNSGPEGSRSSFCSASGLIVSAGCAAATDASTSDHGTRAAIAAATRDFIGHLTRDPAARRRNDV